MNYSIAGALVVLVAIAALAFIFRGRLFTGRVPPVPPDPPAGPQTPPPPTRELYVASLGNHSIVGFAINANGSVASTPSRVIHGPNTGLENPFAIALGNTNRIWVANLGPLLPGQPPTSATITVYDSDANGNATPIRTITSQPFGSGLATTQTLANPSALAMRRVPENLFVACDDSGSVLEFDLTTGDQPTGGFAEAQRPTGVAVDSEQCIYVADAAPGSGSIGVFTPTQPGQYTNQFTSTDPDLRIMGILNPGHLAIGPDRELFVVVRGNFELPTPNPALYVYAVGATGNAAPIRVISGSNTQLLRPYGVAVDESGQAFVSNGESVLVFAAGASGNVAPSETVSHFEINNAGGLAVR